MRGSTSSSPHQSPSGRGHPSADPGSQKPPARAEEGGRPRAAEGNSTGVGKRGRDSGPGLFQTYQGSGGKDRSQVGRAKSGLTFRAVSELPAVSQGCYGAGGHIVPGDARGGCGARPPPRHGTSCRQREMSGQPCRCAVAGGGCLAVVQPSLKTSRLAERT